MRRRHVLRDHTEAFGHRPSWAPLSPLIRRLLRDDFGQTGFTETDWTPLVDPTLWRRMPSGPSERAPILGRHSRDAADKWPDNKDDLRAAYCIGQPLEFRALGGAKIPTAILGSLPRKWSVEPFDAIAPAEFLAGLDFYVYFPQRDMFEACRAGADGGNGYRDAGHLAEKIRRSV